MCRSLPQRLSGDRRRNMPPPTIRALKTGPENGNSYTIKPTPFGRPMTRYAPTGDKGIENRSVKWKFLYYQANALRATDAAISPNIHPQHRKHGRKMDVPILSSSAGSHVRCCKIFHRHRAG